VRCVEEMEKPKKKEDWKTKKTWKVTRRQDKKILGVDEKTAIDRR